MVEIALVALLGLAGATLLAYALRPRRELVLPRDEVGVDDGVPIEHEDCIDLDAEVLDPKADERTPRKSGAGDAT